HVRNRISVSALVFLATTGIGLASGRPLARTTTGDAFIRSVSERPAALAEAGTTEAPVVLSSQADGSSNLLKPGERVLKVIQVTRAPRAPEMSLADAGDDQEGELVIPDALPDGSTPSDAKVAVIRRGSLVTPDGESLETESY